MLRGQIGPSRRPEICRATCASASWRNPSSDQGRRVRVGTAPVESHHGHQERNISASRRRKQIGRNWRSAWPAGRNDSRAHSVAIMTEPETTRVSHGHQESGFVSRPRIGCERGFTTVAPPAVPVKSFKPLLWARFSEREGCFDRHALATMTRFLRGPATPPRPRALLISGRLILPELLARARVMMGGRQEPRRRATRLMMTHGARRGKPNSHTGAPVAASGGPAGGPNCAARGGGAAPPRDACSL